MWGLDRISPPLDWQYSYKYDGTGVTVYSLDTSVRTTHQDFGGRVKCSGFSTCRVGCCGHGTHVADIIIGTRYGISKGATLVSVDVLDESATGTYDTIIAAIDWVISQKKGDPTKPIVINMSFDMPYNTLLNQAVASAFKGGVVVVVAAGNDARNACNYSPASAAEAITVAATTFDNTRARYSNYGSCVDILAPGTDIIAASYATDTSLEVYSGTSAAAAHVTGAVGLYLQRNPTIQPGTLVTTLKADATKNAITFPRTPTPDATPNLFLNVANLLK